MQLKEQDVRRGVGAGRFLIAERPLVDVYDMQAEVHPCPDCGALIDGASTKCQECCDAEKFNEAVMQLQLPATVKAVNGAATFTQSAERLREQFPHGHQAFLPITLRELQLHSDKNHDYSAGGSALGNFERVATLLAMYPKLNLGDPKVVALVYALKQLDAVLWGLNSSIEHKVEGLAGRLSDISVYAKIVMCMLEDIAARKADV